MEETGIWLMVRKISTIVMIHNWILAMLMSAVFFMMFKLLKFDDNLAVIVIELFCPKICFIF